MKSLTSIMLATFLLAMTAPATGLASKTEADLAAQAQDAPTSFQVALEEIVAGSAATISDVSLDQSMRHDAESGARESSCTATATVGNPGGTEVALSATASACGEATGLVTDGVRSLLEK